MQLQIFQGLVEFLQEQTNDHISDSGQFRRRWPLLLCGTLNFNGRKGLMEPGLYSFQEWLQTWDGTALGLDIYSQMMDCPLHARIIPSSTL